MLHRSHFGYNNNNSNNDNNNNYNNTAMRQQNAVPELMLHIHECDLIQLEDGFRLKTNPTYWFVSLCILYSLCLSYQILLF